MKFFNAFAVAMALVAGSNAAPAVSKARNGLPERAIVDVCAFVDAPLVLVVDGVTKDFGLIDICLCLSALPLFLETNAVVLAAIEAVGEAAVLAALKALITTDGFVPCTPTTSSKVKRDMSLANAQCPKGLSLCGVQSSWSRTAWECVDTERDLESCGGCAVGVLGHHATGQDCTAIPGVEDVSCSRGRCEVFACRHGYEISEDGTSCVELAAVEHHQGHHHAASY